MPRVVQFADGVWIGAAPAEPALAGEDVTAESSVNPNGEPIFQTAAVRLCCTASTEASAAPRWRRRVLAGDARGDAANARQLFISKPRLANESCEWEGVVAAFGPQQIYVHRRSPLCSGKKRNEFMEEREMHFSNAV